MLSRPCPRRQPWTGHSQPLSPGILPGCSRRSVVLPCPPCTGLTPTSSCIYLVLVPRGSAAPGNRLVLLALIPKVWLRAQPPQHKSRKVETERRGLASGRTSRALDSSWLLGSWEAPGAAASPALKAAGLWGSGPQALPCSTSQQSGCDGQINSFSKQGS